MYDNFICFGAHNVNKYIEKDIAYNFRHQTRFRNENNNVNNNNNNNNDHVNSDSHQVNRDFGEDFLDNRQYNDNDNGNNQSSRPQPRSLRTYAENRNRNRNRNTAIRSEPITSTTAEHTVSPNNDEEKITKQIIKIVTPQRKLYNYDVITLNLRHAIERFNFYFCSEKALNESEKESLKLYKEKAQNLLNKIGEACDLLGIQRPKVTDCLTCHNLLNVHGGFCETYSCGHYICAWCVKRWASVRGHSHQKSM